MTPTDSPILASSAFVGMNTLSLFPRVVSKRIRAASGSGNLRHPTIAPNENCRRARALTSAAWEGRPSLPGTLGGNSLFPEHHVLPGIIVSSRLEHTAIWTPRDTGHIVSMPLGKLVYPEIALFAMVISCRSQASKQILHTCRRFPTTGSEPPSPIRKTFGLKDLVILRKGFYLEAHGIVYVFRCSADTTPRIGDLTSCPKLHSTIPGPEGIGLV